jgi:hypothetical protein
MLPPPSRSNFDNASRRQYVLRNASTALSAARTTGLDGSNDEEVRTVQAAPVR